MNSNVDFSGLVKLRLKHEWNNGIGLMSKRNEAWNGIMDSIIISKGINMEIMILILGRYIGTYMITHVWGYSMFITSWWYMSMLNKSEICH